MQLNALQIAAAQPKPIVPNVVSAQSAIYTAGYASQAAAPVVKTQTAQATQASGRSEGTREGKSGTEAERDKDTIASTLTARTNGAGYGRHRGSLLDVSV